MRTSTVAALTFSLVAAAASALAQAPPTRVPAATTPDHEAVLRAGVELHDKGQFDAAIAKYQEVLDASPDDVNALYELGFSYLSKRDYDRAFDVGQRGAEFASDLLPMFYDLMASAQDSKGLHDQAVETYRKGIALAPRASQLYFNLAVTYRESLNRPNEARLALEQAAGLEPMYPGAHLLLGQVYQATGYTTPAWLALSTFLVLDPAGSQALPGYGLWRAILKGAVDPIPDAAANGADASAQDQALRMRTDVPPAKTDEGDFSAVDARLGPSHAAFMRALNDGRPEVVALVEQVDSLLGALPAEPTGPAARSFVNTQYVPFFVALKQQNFVEPFVYWASQRAPVPGVREWLQSNEPRVRAFLDWASNYAWPQP